MTRVEFIQQAVIAMIPYGLDAKETIARAKELSLVMMREAPFDDAQLCLIRGCDEVLEISSGGPNDVVCKGHRAKY